MNKEQINDSIKMFVFMVIFIFVIITFVMLMFAWTAFLLKNLVF